MPSFQRLLLLVLIPAGILCSAFPVSAQQADCLCMPIFTSGMPARNSDSMMVDTCGLDAESCVHAAMMGDRNRYYSKTGYLIDFDVPAIRLPTAPEDSILEVTWDAIDTALSVLRADMEGLENKYGSYVLRKLDPADSSSQRFELRMDDYENVDSIVVDLSEIDNLRLDRDPNFEFILSGPADRAEDLGLTVFPSPARDYVIVTAREPARSISLYDLLGREVAVPSISSMSGADRLRLDLHTLPDGVWYLRVNNAVHSLIIQR